MIQDTLPPELIQSFIIYLDPKSAYRLKMTSSQMSIQVDRFYDKKNIRSLLKEGGVWYECIKRKGDKFLQYFRTSRKFVSPKPENLWSIFERTCKICRIRCADYTNEYGFISHTFCFPKGALKYETHYTNRLGNVYDQLRSLMTYNEISTIIDTKLPNQFHKLFFGHHNTHLQVHSPYLDFNQASNIILNIHRLRKNLTDDEIGVLSITDLYKDAILLKSKFYKINGNIYIQHG